MKAIKLLIKNSRKFLTSKHAPAVISLGLMLFFFKPSAALTFPVGVFVFIESVLLYFFFLSQAPKKSSRKTFLVTIALGVGIFILATGIYKDTFYISNFEKNQMWERRELYKRDLGIVGRSNLGNMTIERTKFYLDKLNRKTMDAFDLSRYFSADPSSFYHLIFFPLFIIGAISLLVTRMKFLLYYLGLATFGAILAQPNLVYWLFVPLINFSVWAGLSKLWEKYKS
jgi:hypothetical protein